MNQEYIGFTEMAEAEWLMSDNDPFAGEREHYYWPWFYLLLAAMWGEI